MVISLGNLQTLKKWYLFECVNKVVVIGFLKDEYFLISQTCCEVAEVILNIFVVFYQIDDIPFSPLSI